MKFHKVFVMLFAAASMLGCAQSREWINTSNNQAAVDDLKVAKAACDYDQKAEAIHRAISAASSYLMAGDIGKEKMDAQMARARSIGAEIDQCMSEHGFTAKSTKGLAY